MSRMPEGARTAARNAVLITRPQPGSDETAARVARLDLVPVVAPVLEVRSLPARLPKRIDAVVVTSRNALPGLPPALHATPLFAVGNATAAEARRIGFAQVQSADGDASALAELVRRAMPGFPRCALLHATGRGQGHALEQTLRGLGCVVHRRTLYRADPAQRLSPAAVAALHDGGLRAALFFSTETARTFVRLVTRARLERHLTGIEACAIGQPAAVALRPLPWRRVRVAARPNQDEMLALLR